MNLLKKSNRVMDRNLASRQMPLLGSQKMNFDRSRLVQMAVKECIHTNKQLLLFFNRMQKIDVVIYCLSKQKQTMLNCFEFMIDFSG